VAEVVASLKTIDLRNAETQEVISKDVKTLQALLNVSSPPVTSERTERRSRLSRWTAQQERRRSRRRWLSRRRCILRRMVLSAR
jgi:hypothetical protein